ncbi:MAG: DUF1287 domain-containing protein, partial [Hyphomicrobium sp.]
MKKQKKQKPKSKRQAVVQASGSAQTQARGVSRVTTHIAVRSGPLAALERRGASAISQLNKMTSRGVQAVAATYPADDRQALGLLMLPFLVIAFAIGSSQSMRWPAAVVDPVAEQAAFARPSGPMPAGQDVVVANQQGVPVVSGQSPSQVLAPFQINPPDVAATLPANTALPVTVGPRQALPSTELSTVQLGAGTAVAQSVPDVKALTPLVGPEVIASLAPNDLTNLSPAKPTELAALPQDAGLPVPAPAAFPPAPTEGPGNVCTADAPATITARPERIAALGGPAGGGYVDPIAFGMELAAAAREQLDDFTVYTDKYRTIAYPNGDVPAFYGVCTDVVVRAYRALGIDLQELVHLSKLGSGDTNIDHRRVGTLQKFFATYGESIPISEFSEDYWPGDVVSYYRPQNAHSRTHIAIVSDVVGPSGNFMIIHNRGWGPQQEDGLFVDQITGHYRYSA